MSEIKKPNYTQIPNAYLDKLMYQLSPAENLVMLFIMRKTFGWQKQSDIISYSQIQKGTGLSRPTVSKALKGLIQNNLINATPAGKSMEYHVIFSDDDEPIGKDSEPVKNSDRLNNLTNTGKEFEPISPIIGKDSLHTKERNIKKYIKQMVSAEADTLSKLLYSLHCLIDTGFNRTENQLDKWADDIDKIHRIDGRSWEDIEKVIRWAKDDKFWRDNIISGAKLRQQFDQLIIKVNRTKAEVDYSKVEGFDD